MHTSQCRQAAERGNPAAYVYAARALRDFGDGFVAVLLPVYLTAIGLGPFEVGIVATLALFGSALMTLGIGLARCAGDQRALLMAASGLMIATGLAFALSGSYAVVLLVAFLGTINPSVGQRQHLRSAGARGPRRARWRMPIAPRCSRATA